MNIEEQRTRGQEGRPVSEKTCHAELVSASHKNPTTANAVMTPHPSPLPQGAREKRCAFTLAEVLITLGIIGIVAAVTMPTLLSSHHKKVYVTTLQKVHNDLSQAIGKYMSDQRVESLNESQLAQSGDGMNEFFTNYMNVVKDCGSSYTPCFASGYKKIGGTSSSITGECGASVTLANGVAICATSGVTNAGDVISFAVDINGPDEPNTYGRDFFTFQADRNGQIFDKYFNANSETVKLNDGANSGAFGQIMADSWQMNY
ncbi:prepilin-type N-terminal cleavage/methylation domain-containing protein [bacterium]|nr:prepilin-type N-terminal cleavage/methylation domain-containing protein [bacterium]